MMRIHVLAVCSLLLIGSSAYCDATYEWTDDGGVVHFTDDPATIPKKYRVKSRAKDVQGYEAPTARVPDTAPAQKSEPKAESAELFGGLPLSSWRDSYQTLRKKDEALKRNVEDARQRYATAHRSKMIFQRAKDRQELNQAKEQLDKAERAVEENARQLERLEADAVKAGVPAGWRESASR